MVKGRVRGNGRHSLFVFGLSEAARDMNGTNLKRYHNLD